MPKKHGEGNRQIDGTSAERKEKPPYKWNLLTNFDETVRAIADIEGIPKEDVAKWIQHEMESTSFVALGPIMRDLKSPRLADRRSQHPNERVFSQTLYGSGGGKRYFVYSSGDVEFSVGHHGGDDEAGLKVVQYGIDLNGGAHEIERYLENVMRARTWQKQKEEKIKRQAELPKMIAAEEQRIADLDAAIQGVFDRIQDAQKRGESIPELQEKFKDLEGQVDEHWRTCARLRDELSKQ